MHPNKHYILLKFVKTKITGDARSKLMVRDLTHTWALVKGILEENYAVRRTLDFYACRMFSAQQEKGQNVTSWEAVMMKCRRNQGKQLGGSVSLRRSSEP